MKLVLLLTVCALAITACGSGESAPSASMTDDAILESIGATYEGNDWLVPVKRSGIVVGNCMVSEVLTTSEDVAAVADVDGVTTLAVHPSGAGGVTLIPGINMEGPPLTDEECVRAAEEAMAE